METSMRGECFRELHDHSGVFVVPNPCDAGSAKLLESLGFEALATVTGFWSVLHRVNR